MVNWFDVVTKKHMNELGLLIKNAQKVLYPPGKDKQVQRMVESQ